MAYTLTGRKGGTVRFVPFENGVVEKESESYSSSVTSNPVEDGADINDHVNNAAGQLTISGTIVGGDSAINPLKAMRESRDIITYTGVTRMTNLVFTSLKFDRSYKNRSGASFSATLKQVRLVSSEFVPMDSEVLMSSQDAGKTDNQQLAKTASMGMTTGSVFMLQEVHLFLGRMILLPVVINTGFTTGKAASTGQVCIDFIIRNELADKGHLHHIGLILTQRHIQLIQLFLNEIQLVIVKTKQIGIFRKGFSKFRILLYQGCVETRVIQLFSQVCGFVRETTKRFLMKNCQIVAGTGFFTQIVIKMPQGFCQLLTLISGCFYQFHISCEPTIFKQFSNALGNRFPRNDLRSGAVNGRGTFGKVDTVLGIPRTDIPAIFFQTIAAVIDLL